MKATRIDRASSSYIANQTYVVDQQTSVHLNPQFYRSLRCKWDDVIPRYSLFLLFVLADLTEIWHFDC